MTEFYEVLRGMMELAHHDYPSIYVTIDQDEDGAWYDIVNKNRRNSPGFNYGDISRQTYSSGYGF